MDYWDNYYTIQNVPCVKCGSKVSRTCLTKNGNLASVSHRQRIRDYEKMSGRTILVPSKVKRARTAASSYRIIQDWFLGVN